MGCSSSSPAAVPPAANRGAGGTPSGGTGGARKDAAAPTSPKAENVNENGKSPAPSSAASKLLGLAAFDDPSGDEPSVPVAVGKRRGSQANLTPPPQSAGPAARAGPGGTLPRMESSKNVSLGVGGGTPAGEEGAGSGGAEQGNFMQNIHSSPFQATLAFEAPVYQKSDEDVEFV